MPESDASVAFRRVAASAVAGCLLVAGCGGGDPDEPNPGDDSRRAGENPAQVSPLTGLETPNGLPKHPVAVVKIDNTSAARPQVGLDAADLVVEELVEGGSTRLAALYLSKTPSEVGPVRSMRTTDIGIVRPANGVLVASGGAPSTKRALKNAGIKAFTEGSAGYRRDPGRSAPYNLMMDLGALIGGVEGDAATQPYLPFGDAGTKVAGEPATRLAIAFSGGHTTEWRFAKGAGWVREDSLAAKGHDFVPDTVLALEVEVGDAGYRDPAGNPVPESEFYGSGPAVLFANGKALRCTWSKNGVAGELRLARPDGTPVEVPPGKTWIELVPRATGSVNWTA